MANTTLISVRVKTDIAKRLEKLAKADNRSKSYLACQAIEEYISVQEWHDQAVQEGIAAADRGELIDFEEVKKYWNNKE